MKTPSPLALAKADPPKPLPPLTSDNDSSGTDAPVTRRLKFGMWLFLASETLIFGGFFLIYIWDRYAQEAGFTLGSFKMDFKIGVVNTLILLTSSFAMAIAVMESQRMKKTRVLLSLAAVWILGAIFLALKGLEYKHHYDDGLFPGLHFTYTGDLVTQVYSFMSLYFLGTGLHAVHMIVGMGLVTYLAVKQVFRDEVGDLAEIVGLYWHFVDLVWIFLFPAFYLIGSRG